MDVKDLDPTEKEAHPERMYFTRFASRFDMQRYFTQKVYEDDVISCTKIQILSH